MATDLFVLFVASITMISGCCILYIIAEVIVRVVKNFWISHGWRSRKYAEPEKPNERRKKEG